MTNLIERNQRIDFKKIGWLLELGNRAGQRYIEVKSQNLEEILQFQTYRFLKLNVLNWVPGRILAQIRPETWLKLEIAPVDGAFSVL